MPIFYFILVIYSFIASQIHWPFGNLALILGMLVLFGDILVQIIRLLMKKGTYHLLLLSLSLCFLGIGYTFVWLGWEGMKLTAWLCLLLALPGIVLSFKLKRKVHLRKLITGSMFAILVFFSFMKQSDLYVFKHNLSVDHPEDAPVFVVHYLARIFYEEGNKGRAQILLKSIQKDVNMKTAYFRNQGKSGRYMLDIFVMDSIMVSNDLKQLHDGAWLNYQNLMPEDINFKNLK